MPSLNLVNSYPLAENQDSKQLVSKQLAWGPVVTRKVAACNNKNHPFGGYSVPPAYVILETLSIRAGLVLLFSPPAKERMGVREDGTEGSGIGSTGRCHIGSLDLRRMCRWGAGVASEPQHTVHNHRRSARRNRRGDARRAGATRGTGPLFRERLHL